MDIENLAGSGFDDQLWGDHVANVLYGYGGDDVITGNGGNDTIRAGSGEDVIVFSGNQADYEIETSAGLTLVTHNGAGVDGQDTIRNAEILRFADGDLVLPEIATLFTFETDDPLNPFVSADDNSYLIGEFGGLTWVNGYILDPIGNGYNPSGYVNGLVSGEQVAFNGNGKDLEILAADGDTFDFVSGSFTAAWQDDLTVAFDGFLDGTLIYELDIILDSDAPQLIEFDWEDVDQVVMSASGGTQVLDWHANSTHVAMDDLLIIF